MELAPGTDERPELAEPDQSESIVPPEEADVREGIAKPDATSGESDEIGVPLAEDAAVPAAPEEDSALELAPGTDERPEQPEPDRSGAIVAPEEADVREGIAKPDTTSGESDEIEVPLAEDDAVPAALEEDSAVELAPGTDERPEQPEPNRSGAIVPPEGADVREGIVKPDAVSGKPDEIKAPPAENDAAPVQQVQDSIAESGLNAEEMSDQAAPSKNEAVGPASGIGLQDEIVNPGTAAVESDNVALPQADENAALASQRQEPASETSSDMDELPKPLETSGSQLAGPAIEVGLPKGTEDSESAPVDSDVATADDSERVGSAEHARDSAAESESEGDPLPGQTELGGGEASVPASQSDDETGEADDAPAKSEDTSVPDADDNFALSPQLPDSVSIRGDQHADLQSTPGSDSETSDGVLGSIVRQPSNAESGNKELQVVDLPDGGAERHIDIASGKDQAALDVSDHFAKESPPSQGSAIGTGPAGKEAGEAEENGEPGLQVTPSDFPNDDVTVSKNPEIPDHADARTKADLEDTQSPADLGKPVLSPDSTEGGLSVSAERKLDGTVLDETSIQVSIESTEKQQGRDSSGTADDARSRLIVAVLDDETGLGITEQDDGPESRPGTDQVAIGAETDAEGKEPEAQGSDELAATDKVVAVGDGSDELEVKATQDSTFASTFSELIETGTVNEVDGSTVTEESERELEVASLVVGEPRTDAAIDARDKRLPTFDVVRIDQSGFVTAAGRGAPNAEFRIFADAEMVWKTRSNARGQFASLFTVNLANAPMEITLRSVNRHGEERLGEQTVVVTLRQLRVEDEESSSDSAARVASSASEANGSNSTDENVEDPLPTVLLTTPDGVRLMQASAPFENDQVLVDLITYNENGDVILAGRATTDDGFVRVYLDNELIRDVPVDHDKHWSIDLATVVPDRYVLRVDELARTGEVRQRVEMPFQREEREFVKSLLQSASRELGSNELSPEDQPPLLTVQKGHTLWGISRSRYGLGRLYVNILERNREHIKDPDLIYPGQIFSIPKDDELIDPLSNRPFARKQ